MTSAIFASRPVQEDDLPLICTFPQSAQELFFMFPKADYPLTIEQLAYAISQRYDSTVVLLDNQLAGFANFYRCEPGDCCAIGNVVVSPALRGKGAGRYLIESMVQIALDKYHVKQVEISCFNQNASGLLLYSKIGFMPSKIEKRLDKDGNPVALIQMKRFPENNHYEN